MLTERQAVREHFCRFFHFERPYSSSVQSPGSDGLLILVLRDVAAHDRHEQSNNQGFEQCVSLVHAIAFFEMPEADTNEYRNTP